MQGFAVCDQKRYWVGVQVTQQTRKQGSAKGVKLEIASGFASGKLTEKTSVFGRFDRMFDPNPDGDKTPYLPFASSAKSNFVVAGVDFKPIEGVHLIPNLETVFYDGANGVKPDTDVVGRLTIYYSF